MQKEFSENLVSVAQNLCHKLPLISKKLPKSTPINSIPDKSRIWFYDKLIQTFEPFFEFPKIALSKSPLPVSQSQLFWTLWNRKLVQNFLEFDMAEWLVSCHDFCSIPQLDAGSYRSFEIEIVSICMENHLSTVVSDRQKSPFLG